MVSKQQVLLHNIQQVILSRLENQTYYTTYLIKSKTDQLNLKKEFFEYHFFSIHFFHYIQSNFCFFVLSIVYKYISRYIYIHLTIYEINRRIIFSTVKIRILVYIYLHWKINTSSYSSCIQKRGLFTDCFQLPIVFLKLNQS